MANGQDAENLRKAIELSETRRDWKYVKGDTFPIECGCGSKEGLVKNTFGMMMKVSCLSCGNDPVVPRK